MLSPADRKHLILAGHFALLRALVRLILPGMGAQVRQGMQVTPAGEVRAVQVGRVEL